MSKFLHVLTHGNVSKDFYIKNTEHLLERNVKMLKIGFSFGAAINVILLLAAYVVPLLYQMKTFYIFFSVWFLVWEILTFAVLEKNHRLAKLFYAVLAGSALTMTALTSSYYSPDMCAVIYPVFLIFIPGLYVSRPSSCITTTVTSSIIFCGMVVYFKTDPRVISFDLVNTAFCMVVSIVFNLYNINLQLQNIQSSIILDEQSTTDELTGLPNRRHFNNLIENFFTASEGNELVIYMMDVDYFKKYNDTYGHLKGDECLSLIGKSLRAAAEEYGIFIARYGGEEFVAVDTSGHSVSAPVIADAFVKGIEALRIVNECSVYPCITLSVGYATRSGTNAENYIELINFADEALYQSKHAGRNCFCEYGTKAYENTKTD